MTTITIDRATVEQALEALEALQSYAAAERKGLRICDEAIPALRAALAQQAEPNPDYPCRSDGRCQYAIDHGAEGLGSCPKGKCAIAQPQPAEDRAVAQDNLRVMREMFGEQAEPVEPVAWKQGSLVTFNEDPYPALGGLFVQLWDGEEVAARVYANDLKTLRQRCAKVNTAPPQRKPLTEEEIEHIGITHQSLRQVARAVERAVWEKNNG